MPVIRTDDIPSGNLTGADYGATVSVILDHSEPGGGPRLHRHAYDETWVVEEGSITFQLGDEEVLVGPGRHRHRAARRTAQVHQHRAGAVAARLHPRQARTMVTEWLEG